MLEGPHTLGGIIFTQPKRPGKATSILCGMLGLRLRLCVVVRHPSMVVVVGIVAG